jgi:hypothetical protein
MSREVAIEFFNGAPTYLRAIQLDEHNPNALGVHIIPENFRFQQSNIDTIQYLAIGRHVAWMLCDTNIVPIKGPSHPGCWKIMIQTDRVIQTPLNPRRESTSIHNLHQIESQTELYLGASAEKTLRPLVGNLAMSDMSGYLGFACIFPQAAIHFPCDLFNVDVPVGANQGWEVCIPVRF